MHKPSKKINPPLSLSHEFSFWKRFVGFCQAGLQFLNAKAPEAKRRKAPESGNREKPSGFGCITPGGATNCRESSAGLWSNYASTKPSNT